MLMMMRGEEEKKRRYDNYYIVTTVGLLPGVPNPEEEGSFHYFDNRICKIVLDDKLWIVDIMFDVKYLAALHARCSIVVLVVKYVAKRDELDLS